MTILAWQQAGPRGAPAVVLLHGWASDGTAEWQVTGWVAALERAGLTAYVPDLPGHGVSADVLVPPDAEPATWTANAVLNDVGRLGLREFALAGAGLGGLVAAHVATRAETPVTRLVLVGVGGARVGPAPSEVAAGLRDAAGRVWRPEVATAVAAARADRRHHLPTLAQWAERAAWPAAARLGASRVPVLLAVGRDDPRREEARQLAAGFFDARVVTVAGNERTAVAAAGLLATAVRFLGGSVPTESSDH